MDTDVYSKAAARAKALATLWFDGQINRVAACCLSDPAAAVLLASLISSCGGNCDALSLAIDRARTGGLSVRPNGNPPHPANDRV